MDVSISFTNFEHTPDLDQMISRKTKRLEKILDKNAKVIWHCRIGDGGHESKLHIVEKGGEYFSHDTEDSLYKTLDKAVSKIERQILKRKH